jgi:hypothetical protein
MYVPSFTEICAVIRIWTGWDTRTGTQKGDAITLLLFFQNKESKLKIVEIKCRL